MHSPHFHVSAVPEAGALVAGKYRVRERLGSGSVAEVFRVEHEQLHKDFALKIMRLDRVSMTNLVARFEREARALERLDHPNIVRVIELGQTERGAMYLAMELAEGIPLSEWIDEGALSASSAFAVMTQVLAGLEHAHSRGVLHRDLKPENIMITDVGGNLHAKVVDFGVAKLTLQRDASEPKLSKPGTVCGTPYNMSPEQIVGHDVDARSDLYAAGVLFYTLLDGRPPFEGSALEVMKAHVLEKPAPPVLRGVDPALAPKIRELVMRALAKEPERRFGDATEMRAAIEAIDPARRSRSTPAGGTRLPRSVSAPGERSRSGVRALRPPIKVGPIFVPLAVSVLIALGLIVRVLFS